MCLPDNLNSPADIADNVLGLDAKRRQQEQAQQAQQAEQKRQQQIQQVLDRINQIYSDPQYQKEMQQFADAQYQNWQDLIGRKSADMIRSLKADYARTGMIGSSEWENALAQADAAHRQALAESEARKQALLDAWKRQEEAARANLEQQARQGLSLTEAEQLAQQSLAQALAAAKDQANADWIDQTLSAAGKAYLIKQKQKGAKSAIAAYTAGTGTPAPTSPSTALTIPPAPWDTQQQAIY